MNSHELITFVHSARAAGESYEAIAERLGQSGWRMADILPALTSNEPALPKVPESAHKGYAIQADNVTKSFGTVAALKGVSIRVPYGKVFGLLGPNGAGKTTLVRILTTLLNHDGGTVTVGGFDVRHEANSVRGAVGLTGQYAATDEYLTGRENLELVGRLYHLDKETIRKRTDELLEKFGLTDAADRPAKTYSGGMRRRLDLAMSLFNRPKILFLDEPTTGLDPQSRIALWQIIKELVADGTTVLLTTQYLEEADHLADRIVVINHGQIIAEGTSRELKSKIGGDVLEVHASTPTDVDRIVALLRHLAKEAPHVQPELGMVSIPTVQGPSSLVEAVRLLDKEKIGIADIMLRRPTLDDVFLSLTGHTEAVGSEVNFFSSR